MTTPQDNRDEHAWDDVLPQEPSDGDPVAGGEIEDDAAHPPVRPVPRRPKSPRKRSQYRPPSELDRD